MPIAAYTLTDSVRHVTIQNYLHLLSTAILYYDHSITFSNEVHYIWTRPRTAASLCFFINRYLSFLSSIAVVAGVLTTIPAKSCSGFLKFRQLLLVATQAVIALILLLRTYAVCRRKKQVLWALLVVLAFGLGVIAWALHVQGPFRTLTMDGCHAAYIESAIYIAIPWELLLGYDLIIFGLTVHATHHGLTERSQFRAMNRSSIKVLLLRDGAIYFVIMGGANLANVLTFYYSSPVLRGCLSTFASNISVTMISRLTINLFKTSHRDTFDRDAESLNLVPMVFTAAGREDAECTTETR